MTPVLGVVNGHVTGMWFAIRCVDAGPPAEITGAGLDWYGVRYRYRDRYGVTLQPAILAQREPDQAALTGMDLVGRMALGPDAAMDHGHLVRNRGPAVGVGGGTLHLALFKNVARSVGALPWVPVEGAAALVCSAVTGLVADTSVRETGVGNHPGFSAPASAGMSEEIHPPTLPSPAPLPYP